MLKVVAYRLAISVPLLVIVSLVTFLIASLSPGNAALAILGQGATPEQIAELEQALGLNKPVLVQYGDWLAGAIRGDFGSSLVTGQPVLQALTQRLQPTLSLLISSVVVVAIIGCGLGVFAATRGGALARIIDLLTFVGLAIPNFVFALYLIPLFALTLRLLPASGYSTLAEGIGPWASSLVLPVVAMAFGAVGTIAKQTRASMEDALGREFVPMMRANGYSRRSIVYRHALKTAGMPMLTAIGLSAVGVISGTVLLEAVFAFPGLGGLAVQASGQGDIPVVLGVTVMFTIFVIIINLLVDLGFAAINPKVRAA
ncbi:ABC transporter permease [Microbacterium sp. KSW4-11]|uniref:ABC transporter permease n=1 Tax=Microbacterium gawkjiense TaxID=3067309 RepID=A0ABU3GA74_9MICO|nr:ABC transporter permease [Microbacterium sp. KSW4-11]MDT3316386.1 ABC transporter permease [Microbacterium sp. KSW4-11]